MAIVWGAWSSNNRLRAGIEMSMSPATVGSGTTSVNITTKVYLQTRFASFESGSSDTWFVSGDVAAQGNTDWNLGDMGTILMGTDVQAFATSYTSTNNIAATARIHSYFAYPGTEATASTSITIPKRPYTVPAAPSGIARARVSDTQHTITWTNNTSAGAPYTNLYLERWDNVSGAYLARATLAGAATSFSDTTTGENRQYSWRVRAQNSAGYSAYNESTSIKTAPSASGTPMAAKTAGGDIVLTWSGNSAIAENIEIWHYANGVLDGAALATIGMVTTYTHVAPNPAQTHKYKLRSKIASPALTSAFTSDSNTVQLQAAPNAPTDLAPASVAKDRALGITLSWTHNPVDTTPQRKKQMLYRVNGGAWNDAGVVTDSVSTWDIASNFFAAGTVEWQVFTWGSATTGGSDGTGRSPGSAVAAFTTGNAPSAVLVTPNTSATWGSSAMTVAWAYSDPDLQAQAGYNVKLYAAGGASILETKSGAGAVLAADLVTQLQDATSYVLGVSVQDSAGLWSAEATQAFTVTYAQPPVPTVSLSWSPEDGAVMVSITNPDPVDPEVDTDTNQVWRSANGADWSLIAVNLPPNTAVMDPIPALGVINSYRVVALSALPSVAESAVADIVTSGAVHTFLNAGPGFAQMIRLGSNVQTGESGGRARRERRTAGREYPVAHDGSQRTREFQVTALLWNERLMADRSLRSSTWIEILDFADLPSPACYRDIDGAREFVMLESPSLSDKHSHARTVSIGMAKTDYQEVTEAP